MRLRDGRRKGGGGMALVKSNVGLVEPAEFHQRHRLSRTVDRSRNIGRVNAPEVLSLVITARTSSPLGAATTHLAHLRIGPVEIFQARNMEQRRSEEHTSELQSLRHL